MKIFSLLYLVVISIALLVPLDFFLIENIIQKDHLPNNNTSFAIHFILFFILHYLFYFSFLNKLKIIFFFIIYSIIIESLQIFSFRSFQIFDIMWNIMGILFSYLSLSFFKFKKKL